MLRKAAERQREGSAAMRHATARRHEPDQAAFRAILPEEIDWKPFPAFPPSVRLAVLVGEPTQAGPYLIRVKSNS
jgi:hypothetical protein